MRQGEVWFVAALTRNARGLVSEFALPTSIDCAADLNPLTDLGAPTI